MGISDSRALLRSTLERVLGGNELPLSDMDGLLSLNPTLDYSERAAVVQLWNWIEDKDLREYSPRHADFSRRRLQELLESLG